MVVKKLKDGSEKLVITSMEEYDRVVNASLSNGAPLAVRGINVCHRSYGYYLVMLIEGGAYGWWCLLHAGDTAGHSGHRIIHCPQPAAQGRAEDNAAYVPCFLPYRNHSSALVPPDAEPISHILMDYKTLHPDSTTKDKSPRVWRTSWRSALLNGPSQD